MVRLYVAVIAAWAMCVGFQLGASVAGRTEPRTDGRDLLEDRAMRLERAKGPRASSPAQPAEALETLLPPRRAARPHRLDTRDPWE
jgi:hypothetical protein